jgi:hypothetical protein
MHFLTPLVELKIKQIMFSTHLLNQNLREAEEDAVYYLNQLRYVSEQLETILRIISHQRVIRGSSATHYEHSDETLVWKSEDESSATGMDLEKCEKSCQTRVLSDDDDVSFDTRSRQGETPSNNGLKRSYRVLSDDDDDSSDTRSCQGETLSDKGLKRSCIVLSDDDDDSSDTRTCQAESLYDNESHMDISDLDCQSELVGCSSSNKGLKRSCRPRNLEHKKHIELINRLIKNEAVEYETFDGSAAGSDDEGNDSDIDESDQGSDSDGFLYEETEEDRKFINDDSDEEESCEEEELSDNE